MAHCAFLLAIVLPFLVAAAHIIATGQLPVSSTRQLVASSFLRRQPTTSSSPRRQPPSSSRAMSSSFEVRHQPLDTEDVPSFFGDRHQSSEPKLEPEPEPAVLEELMKRGSKAGNMVERLEHLSNVLRLFGYNSMASAVMLLVDSRMLAVWSAPVTVFAVPDAALEDACPSCPLRLVVLKQFALGSYTFSELSSRPSLKLPTPAIKFCMSSMTTIVLSLGGDITKVVSINSVDITRPELYNDGRFIIHGVKSYIYLPPQGSCTRDGPSLSLAEVMKNLRDTFGGQVL